MARFRKKVRRAKRTIKAASRRYQGSTNPLKVVIPAMIYGATRGYVSNAIKPLTDKIPLGSYADEAIFGVAGYFMAKKGKGLIKDAGMAILTVESASLGNQIMGNVIVPATNGNSKLTYDY